MTATTTATRRTTTITEHVNTERKTTMGRRTTASFVSMKNKIQPQSNQPDRHHNTEHESHISVATHLVLRSCVHMRRLCEGKIESVTQHITHTQHANSVWNCNRIYIALHNTRLTNCICRMLVQHNKRRPFIKPT